ncbi:MAG: hypothetical protein ACLRQF_15050 [Thomasclavelia ramosa]
MEKYGRLTLPTDLDVIDQTIELKINLGLMQFEIVMGPTCLKN